MFLRRNVLPLLALAAVLLATGSAAALTPPLFQGPAIFSVGPSEVGTSGSETVTILGSNFREPLRVFFDRGNENLQAFVLSSTDRSLTVLAPRVDVAPRGWRLASVRVVTEAGTANETRVTSENAVRFVDWNASPRIITASPAYGSLLGGMRVTIFGELFYAPMQVFAVHADGSETELRIVSSVRFDQVAVIMAPGSPGESVALRIVTYNNGKSVTLPDAFHYTKPMSITRVTPSSGPVTGGTRVTIDGSGFLDPSAVVIGGIAAVPVEVSDGRVIAITQALPDPKCQDHAGSVTVISIDSGESADAPPFTYITPRMEVASAPSKVTAGSVINVRLNGAGGQVAFALDGRPLTLESWITSADGTTTYRVRVPADVAGARCRAAQVTLTAVNLQTGCNVARTIALVPLENGETCPGPRARS